MLQLIAMGLDPTDSDPQLLLSPLQTARDHARELGAAQLQQRPRVQPVGGVDGRTNLGEVDLLAAEATAAAEPAADHGHDVQLTEHKSSRDLLRLQSVCPPPPGSIRGRLAVRRAQFQQRHDFLSELLREWRQHSARVRSMLQQCGWLDLDSD